jgi:hypothetical protein
MCKDLDVTLTEPNIDLISEMQSSVCALMLLDLYDSGKLTKPPKNNVWKHAEAQEALHGDLWLLSYEAGVRSWGGFNDNHIRADPHFDALRNLGVRFYDQKAQLKPIFHLKQSVASADEDFDWDAIFGLDEIEDLIEFDEGDGGYEGVVVQDEIEHEDDEDSEDNEDHEEGEEEEGFDYFA